MTEDERCAAFVRATDEMIALAYAATSEPGSLLIVSHDVRDGVHGVYSGVVLSDAPIDL